jgi:hypothetical protein
MDKFLEELVPAARGTLVGATDEDIDQIEALAGLPLPKFYRWFLSRMGLSMGPLGYARLDLSARTIVSCYEDEIVAPDGRFIMIGYSTDAMVESHLFYDCNYPSRDDARVIETDDVEGPLNPQFETLREMFAWGKFLKLRVNRSPQRCRGILVSTDGNVLSHLDPLMSKLGFVTPAAIPTGPLCSLYEHSTTAMVTSSTPDEDPQLHGFGLGGPDAGTLRRILGEIATTPSLSVEIKEWTPTLP